MTCRHPLPTFDEIPPASSSVGRDLDGFLRLQLLPSDDADLRAKATEWFIASERQDGTEGTLSHDEFQIVLKRLSDVPARTPGGLAWKLVTVLDYFADEEKWDWWRLLLQSAVLDAIELERCRAASSHEGGAS